MGMTYKPTRSQIALSLLASLLTLAPLFSSSLRLTYIYFIFNLLIIALGAEAGLLSNPNPKNHNSRKKPEKDDSEFLQKKDEIRKMESIIQKYRSQKIAAAAAAAKKIVQVIKCDLSIPSIFFIGDGEVEVEVQEDREFQEVEEEEVFTKAEGQELFTKSENFIGNFYKQLDMQRDQDSWKEKTHGFYIISQA